MGVCVCCVCVCVHAYMYVSVRVSQSPPKKSQKMGWKCQCMAISHRNSTETAAFQCTLDVGGTGISLWYPVGGILMRLFALLTGSHFGSCAVGTGSRQLGGSSAAKAGGSARELHPHRRQSFRGAPRRNFGWDHPVDASGGAALLFTSPASAEHWGLWFYGECAVCLLSYVCMFIASCTCFAHVAAVDCHRSESVVGCSVAPCVIHFLRAF